LRREQRIDLQSLLELTLEVQEAVTCGDWEQASALELQRGDALKTFIQEQRVSHGGLEHISAELAELQQNNNRLIGEVHHHRRSVAREASMLQHGKQAVREYIEQSSTRE